jgi:hypothetical protein
MVYDAVGAGAGCAPLAVVSHGAGGSERGYRYLAVATIDSLLIGVHSGKMHFAGGAAWVEA